MGMEFYETDDKVVSVTNIVVDKIHRLKSHRADDSGYTPGGVMLQWRFIDNQDVCKTEDDFKSLYMPMQFASMVGIISNEFKEKYNVEYHHEALLRILYLDLDSDEDGILITTGFKRPFGNSYVEGDVAEEMKATFSLFGKKEFYPYNIKDGIELGEDDLEYDGNVNESLVEKEYYRFLDILEAYMKEFTMLYTIFTGFPKVIGGSRLFRKPEDRFDWSKYLPYFGNHRLHPYMENWCLDKSELRGEKIENIIS